MHITDKSHSIDTRLPIFRHSPYSISCVWKCISICILQDQSEMILLIHYTLYISHDSQSSQSAKNMLTYRLPSHFTDVQHYVCFYACIHTLQTSTDYRGAFIYTMFQILYELSLRIRLNPNYIGTGPEAHTRQCKMTTLRTGPEAHTRRASIQYIHTMK